MTNCFGETTANHGLLNCYQREIEEIDAGHSCSRLACKSVYCGPCLAGQVEETLSDVKGEYADKDPHLCVPRLTCCAILCSDVVLGCQLALGAGSLSALGSLAVCISTFIPACLVGLQAGRVRTKRGETSTCDHIVCDFATGCCCFGNLNSKNYRDTKTLLRNEKKTLENVSRNDINASGNDNHTVVASQPEGVGLLL